MVIHHISGTSNTMLKSQGYILFAIAVILLSGCRSATTPEESQETDAVQNATFKLIPEQISGVDFTNTITENYSHFFEFFAYVYNGGGVAAGDLNNDGRPDLYFSGNEVPDKVYINEGDFKFRDITAKAVSTGQNGWHNGVTFVDINGDGWLDIYVCRGGWQDREADRRNMLYINQHDETFKEEAAAYGLDEAGYSMQAAFFDMDNDGDLDVYITNRPDSFYLPLSLMASRAIDPPAISCDKLYRNDHGHYTEVSKSAGIINYGYSLGLCVGDVNDDGFADIFVANDYSTPDHLYINQQDGTFKDESHEAFNHISLFSMGTDIMDINNDGREDIAVMEMRPEDYVRSKVSMPSMNVDAFRATVDAGMHKQYMHNMLHLNQGDGMFSEISQLAGVSKTDWSWTCLFADFNNDGYRDMLVTNGMRRDLFDGDVQLRLSKYIEANRSKFKTPEDLFGPGFKGIIESYKPVKIRNYLFMNNGDLHFRDIRGQCGFEEESFSNGAAIADFDGDGDPDIVINNIDGPAFIYNNTTPGNASWLKIKLEGPPGNTSGIGTKIHVYAGNLDLFQEQKLTRGYLSSQDPVLHFGLHHASTIDSILVEWPGENIQRLRNIEPNQLLTLSYAAAHQDNIVSRHLHSLFGDETKAVIKPGFIHQENDFNEFREQVLLPHQFSTAGPKMCAADLNNDGIMDFFIGGAAGFAGAVYLSSADEWVLSAQPALISDAAYEDMGATFFDVDGDGDQDLFVVSGGSQFPDGNALYEDRLYRNDEGKFTRQALAVPKFNGSCVLAGDFDHDGDNDLFITGFVKPNQYPLSSSSYILKNENGKLVDATSDWLSIVGDTLGIIYAITSANLDDDPDKEIILAGEWSPITILKWDGKKFVDHTAEMGLDKTRGWWASVHVVDIDGDGDQDIVAGNLGENYKFSVTGGNSFMVFAEDFDHNGTNDIFLAKGKADHLLPVRGKECTSQQMPDIAQRFPTFQSFAESDLAGVIGRDLRPAVKRQVDMFSTTLFINEHGHFTPLRLPTEAQFSIVNAIGQADLNEDGKPDLILAGNRFDTEVETTPSDASMGCVLINLGHGQFRSLTPAESGLYLHGDVKDMLIFLNSGVTTILVANNRGPLIAWQNKWPSDVSL